MPEADEYLTVAGRGTAEIRIKGSRFIAAVAPVGSEKQALSIVDQVSSEHFGATHHCYAFRVGHCDQTISRFSDAGEPSGTAGRPILEAISGHGLTDVLVVVTRYFGGTKLGTGGLARAYQRCARAALERAGMARKYLTVDFSCRFPYPLTREVKGLIGKFAGKILEGQYGERVEMTVRVRRSLAQNFRETLDVLGKGEVSVRDKHFKL